ncbi:SDR family oxidoreductase [Streptomyces adustus]|uniref:SDR family oxidoreductase n=1 Tax=Streptomyces adustus TaxID=1609272 RepID=UPI0035D5F795
MKAVVIGGTGLIGSKVVRKLDDHGHEAVPASPKTGVNTLTGEGLADVLQGAQVVIDVSNSPSYEDEAVMHFFRTSTTNLLQAAAEAGVTHYVALSIVGTDRLPENGYFRAKLAQEKLIKASGLPYSVVHATQFFEFMNGIADSATEGDTVRIAPVKFQPIHSDDVATAVARTAAGTPLDGTVEIAGPDTFRFDELVRDVLTAQNDPRTVVADPHAPYFGSELQEASLVPGAGAQLAGTRFADWFAQQKK